MIFVAACGSQTVESQKLPGPAPTTVVKNAPTPVLVELFTSEGCSSCPPAERALEFLRREQPVPQAEIIALELHVDYWDRLGWKDEFSSALFSQRQEFYSSRFKLDSVYTPQMVIDGSFELNGADTGRATRLIQDALKQPKASIRAEVAGDSVTIGIGDIPKHDDATVFLAITEDRLARDVSSGENRNKRLEHSSVVRELTAVGKVPRGLQAFDGKASISISSDWKREFTSVVVFIQENASRKILGAVKVALE